MKIHRLSAENEIDKKTGFRCITVFLDDKPYEPHYHDYYELFLTLSEGVVHVINGVDDLLPKGALVFIRKRDKHFFKPNSNDEICMVNLAVSEEIIENLFLFLSNDFPANRLLKDKNPPKVVLGSIDLKRIIAALNAINAGPIDDYHKSLGYKKLLVSIFCEHFNDYPFKKIVLQIPFWLKDFAVKMKKIENFSASYDEIIKLSGKSKEHLSRSVRKYYNVSLSEYINDIRLNYVANSLMSSDLPITQLFYDSGFGTLSYGYVLFKKKFGMSPKTMREKVK